MTVAAVKLPPNPIRHFYRGGPAIAELRGIDVGGDHSPEEWVGSATTLFGESERGLSRLPDGAPRPRRRWPPTPRRGSAPHHAARFGASPALLVKLLDAGERLPVHHHPDGAFAREHLGLDFGKTEAWIVLAARDGARGRRRLARGRRRGHAARAGSTSRTTTRCSARCNPLAGERGRRDLRPRRRAPRDRRRRSSSPSCRSPPTSRSCSSGTASGSTTSSAATLGPRLGRRAGQRRARRARRRGRCAGPRADGAGRRAAARRGRALLHAPSASRPAAAPSQLPAGFAVVIVIEGAGTLAGLDVTPRRRRSSCPMLRGPSRADGDLVAIACRPPGVPAS